jgi:hypothetical protein
VFSRSVLPHHPQISSCTEVASLLLGNGECHSMATHLPKGLHVSPASYTNTWRRYCFRPTDVRPHPTAIAVRQVLPFAAVVDQKSLGLRFVNIKQQRLTDPFVPCNPHVKADRHTVGTNRECLRGVNLLAGANNAMTVGR